MNVPLLVMLVVAALSIVWVGIAIPCAILIGRSVKRGDEASEFASLGREVRRADAVADAARATQSPFTFGPAASPIAFTPHRPLRTKMWGPQVEREAL